MCVRISDVPIVFHVWWDGNRLLHSGPLSLPPRWLLVMWTCNSTDDREGYRRRRRRLPVALWLVILLAMLVPSVQAKDGDDDDNPSSSTTALAPFGAAIWDPSLSRTVVFDGSEPRTFFYRFNVTLHVSSQFLVLRINQTAGHVNLTAHISRPGPSISQQTAAGAAAGSTTASHLVWQRSRVSAADNQRGSPKVQSLVLKPSTSGSACIAAGGVSSDGYCSYTIVVRTTVAYGLTLRRNWVIAVNGSAPDDDHDDDDGADDDAPGAWRHAVAVRGYVGSIFGFAAASAVDTGSSGAGPSSPISPIARLNGVYFGMDISDADLPVKITVRPSVSDVSSDVSC
jgi:hypothetical protein